MLDFIFSIDKWLFIFFNQTLANPVSDAAMPVLTDLNKTWWGLCLYFGAWLLLMWKGGRKGRIIGLLLIPLITLSDQVNSDVIKNLFHRARPCHTGPDGLPIIEHVHLLVPCGSGYSFPSSHAVNNFAVATLMSYYYRKWWWGWLGYAAAVGYSRIAVGVHYPIDVVGGALIGGMFAFLIILLWKFVEARVAGLRISPVRTSPERSGEIAEPGR